MLKIIVEDIGRFEFYRVLTGLRNYSGAPCAVFSLYFIKTASQSRVGLEAIGDVNMYFHRWKTSNRQDRITNAHEGSELGG